MKDDGDKSAILRRRAFFVTSALAALGSCTREPTPAVTPVVVPEPAPDAGVEAMDAAPPSPERDSGEAELPSLEPPEGVSEAAQRYYQTLASKTKAAHEALDRIERALPKACDFGSAGCEPTWRSLADAFHDVERAMALYFVCPSESEDARAFKLVEKAHLDHLKQRRERVERAALERAGGANTARWEELKNQAAMAHPMPCLKFACPEW